MSGAVSGLPDKILKYINVTGSVDTLDVAIHFNEDHQKVIGAVKSLQAVDDLISAEPCSRQKWELTKEGEAVARNGSHEAVVWKAVPAEGILQSQLMQKVSNPIGFSKAMSNGWILVKKDNGAPIVFRKLEAISDSVQMLLQGVNEDQGASLTEAIKKDLKKRKLLQEVIIKSFLLGKGKLFTSELVKAETDLSADMIATGSWKSSTFKPYNFAALGSQPDIGHLHPLLKVRAEFRQIFLEMGFTEMATNNYVESSFWNFDALFQPQQHPARDAHDTFFISDPKVTTVFPSDYLARVKKVHSSGGFGSQGYGYDWKVEEAQKNLLRTHTTAVSARMLYGLANSEQGFRPAKYFSIDRVFRNETLDATHLAEFHQVEGVVADYDLTLGDLIGVLHEFFKKLGLEQLQFKPAYNPYTEPSMEIFCFHPGLGRWVEIGNSGIFRPEMLLPMGLPENVSVIAWGLSLERPTMIKYGLNNIRDLVGPKVDLQMVYNNPICRLEEKNVSRPTATLPLKEYKVPQEILHQELLNELKSTRVAHEIPILTIHADPKYCPHSVMRLVQLVGNVAVSHQLPRHLDSFFSEYLEVLATKSATVNTLYQFLFVWDNVGKDAILIHPFQGTDVRGEVNIVRYISHLLVKPRSTLLLPEYCTAVDQWLDLIHSSFIHGTVQNRNIAISQVSDTLNNQKWLMGNLATIADLCLWSVLYRTVRCNDTATVSPDIVHIFKRYENVDALIGLIESHYINNPLKT